MKCPNCNGQMIGGKKEIPRCTNCNFIKGAENADSKQKAKKKVSSSVK